MTQTTINWRSPDTETDEGEIVVIDTGSGLHTGRVRCSMVHVETGEHVTEIKYNRVIYRWGWIDRWALWGEDAEVTQ